MQKKIVLVVVGLAVVSLGVFAVVSKRTKHESSQNAASSTGVSNYGAKDACNYLTAETATQVLGAGAEKGAVNAAASSPDVGVTSCTYTSPTDGTLGSIQSVRTASLYLRTSLTGAGEVSNSLPFKERKPGSQEVTGYGDAAFWDAELGQLNVHIKSAWMIISNGPAKASSRTLDDARKLADLILAKY